MASPKIAILSSVHPALDHRVFHKEARSLASSGFNVVVVANAVKPDLIDGVRIVPFKQFGGRFTRMTLGLLTMYRMAMKEGADAYHLHDPELLIVALGLKIAGKRVVYDAHESLTGGLRNKHWIPKPVRPLISILAGAFERGVAMLLDGIIVANPEQAGPFPRTKTQIVQNFPTLTEMVPSPDLPYESRKRRAVYVGRLSETRGIRQMVAAAGLVKDPEFRLVLGGKFVPDAIKEDVADDPGWEKVEYLGEIDRKTLVKVYNESRLGLVVMHPTPSFLSNQPVKLFEHMLARLPSVVSDFTNYRKYVAEIDAGLVVNPLDPSQIADAIQWLLDHPEDAQRMGHNGQKAIIENYNWEAEAEKMVKFYRTVVLT